MTLRRACMAFSRMHHRRIMSIHPVQKKRVRRDGSHQVLPSPLHRAHPPAWLHGANGLHF
jgi:hypothetical protein